MRLILKPQQIYLTSFKSPPHLLKGELARKEVPFRGFRSVFRIKIRNKYFYPDAINLILRNPATFALKSVYNLVHVRWL